MYGILLHRERLHLPNMVVAYSSIKGCREYSASFFAADFSTMICNCIYGVAHHGKKIMPCIGKAHQNLYVISSVRSDRVFSFDL